MVKPQETKSRYFLTISKEYIKNKAEEYISENVVVCEPAQNSGEVKS